MPTTKPRRWFRYSLRTLLVVMTVVCLVSGFWLNKAIRQRDAIRRFYQLTADRNPIGYYLNEDDDDWIRPDWNRPTIPMWLSPLYAVLGEEAFGDVIAVNLNRTLATDDDLCYLADLPMVKHVWLQHTKVTDRGVRRLHACPKLKFLILDDTAITDDGLAQLEGLRALTHLYLARTQITDAGLEHLKKLTRLRELWLHGTSITDAGCRKLRAALPQCEISADVPSSNKLQNLDR